MDRSVRTCQEGTDLSLLSVDDLAKISRSLYNRSRKTLGMMKPSEKFSELLAHTARARRDVDLNNREATPAPIR